MASCLTPVSISGGSHLKGSQISRTKFGSFGRTSRVSVQRGSRRNLTVSAEYGDSSKSSGGDFVAGFLLGGAVFGTLAYVFAPQIRRSLLNEDEYGFRRPRGPVYYDEGFEKTRDTLNEKISQLNSAIDKVSTRLRGGNKAPRVPIESEPEIEAV